MNAARLSVLGALLLAALVGYLGLLDFGVRGAVTRYVAHHHATGAGEQRGSGELAERDRPPHVAVTLLVAAVTRT